MTAKVTSGLLFSAIMLGTQVSAYAATSIESLAEKYAGRLMPTLALQVYGDTEGYKLGDCTLVASPEEPTYHVRELHVHGLDFAWRLTNIDDSHKCLFMLKPEYRGLSIEEAQVLLTASILVWQEFDPESPEHTKSAVNYQRESLGAHDTFETGTINEHAYLVRYKGIGPKLAPLDRVQHDFADKQKKELKRISHRSSQNSYPFRPPLNVECSGGKTIELAWLLCSGNLKVGEAPNQTKMSSWLLHIPSGKLLSFDDLFTDPLAARARVSKSVRNRTAGHMAISAIEGIKLKRKFEAEYSAAWRAATSPSPEHFRIVTIDIWGPTVELDVIFDPKETIPGSGDYPYASMPIEELNDLLKPAFRSAFGLPPR